MENCAQPTTTCCVSFADDMNTIIECDDDSSEQIAECKRVKVVLPTS